MIKQISLTAAAGVVALAAIGSNAQAATVTLSNAQSGGTFGTPNFSEQVTRTISGSATYSNGTKTLPAGMFRLTDGAKDFLAFCLEPGTNLTLSQTFSTTAQTLLSASQMTLVDKLFTSAYGLVNSASTAAAFQLALWEIAVDGETTNSLSLSGGRHKITNWSGSTRATAQGFLDGLSSAGTGGYTLTTYVNGGQDVISATPSAVPLPASVVLLAGGLAGLGALRRKKSS